MDGALSTRATPRDVDRLVEAVGCLKPEIDAVRDELDQCRRLPPGLVDSMRASGIFGLWLPRSLGGAALTVVDYVQVIEELARMDGSVGWCASIGASYSRLAGYLEPEIASVIFGGGRTVVAGQLMATGKAVAVAGGYRVTGRWAFGSGIEHSDWTIGICVIHDGDAPRLGLDRSPVERLVFFPTGAARIIDTWHVAGLRGTGSHDYSVSDLFVPENHTIEVIAPVPTTPGPLYALPFRTVFGAAIAAAALGIARGAIDAFERLTIGRAGRGWPGQLRDMPAVQADVGKAESTLRSGRAFLLETAREAWEQIEAGGSDSLRMRALLRLANTQAVVASAQAVDLLYNAGGGNSVYESSRLERCFRDVHTATQHRAVSAGNYEIAGSVLLGLDPGIRRL
jgi:alkylation response protein AidB-like acyl-CoA dehydrogenase